MYRNVLAVVHGAVSELDAAVEDAPVMIPAGRFTPVIVTKSALGADPSVRVVDANSTIPTSN
jgi:hypothetical protein